MRSLYLNWNRKNVKGFQGFGVDRGVLYPKSGDAEAWTGLTSVKKKLITRNPETVYIDGIRTNVLPSFYDPSWSVGCYDYPDSLDKNLRVNNTTSTKNLEIDIHDTVHETDTVSFSYRTYVNEKDYYIHYVFNCLPYLGEMATQTKNKTFNVSEMVFGFEPVPFHLQYEPGRYISTNHISISSKIFEGIPLLKEIVESQTYGYKSGDVEIKPSLREVQKLIALFFQTREKYVLIKDEARFPGEWLLLGPDKHLSVGEEEFTANRIKATQKGDGSFIITDGDLE